MEVTCSNDIIKYKLYGEVIFYVSNTNQIVSYIAPTKRQLNNMIPDTFEFANFTTLNEAHQEINLQKLLEHK
ncbi:MAG: hypothetical protein COA63_014045 [Methylophaga sp.]|nr:hypothetical protein [Methylophaga sp.]